MTEEINDFLRRLLIDLESAGVAPPIGIFNLSQRRWIAGEPLTCADGFGDDGFVLALPGRQQLISAGVVSRPDLIEIASRVTEWVMGKAGQGWPEAVDESGAFHALLEPTWEDGKVVWKGGGVSVPLGSLASASISPLRRTGTPRS